MSLLISGVVLGVGGLVLLRWFERRVAFLPTKGWESPSAHAPGARCVETFFRSPDGVRLSGLWMPAPSPKGVIVYCHGNAGNLSHRVGMAHDWMSLGYSVLLFDYRGYGRSEGTPTEEGLTNDTLAAYDEALRRGGEEPILFGRSLGTVPAVRVAALRPVRGLVLDSPLTNARAMAYRILPLPGIHWLLSLRLDNDARIDDVACPILIMHGDSDEIIPFDQGRALFNLASEPKQFLPLVGLRHNDDRGRPTLLAALGAFLDALPR